MYFKVSLDVSNYSWTAFPHRIPFRLWPHHSAALQRAEHSLFLGPQTARLMQPDLSISRGLTWGVVRWDTWSHSTRHVPLGVPLIRLLYMPLQSVGKNSGYSTSSRTPDIIQPDIFAKWGGCDLIYRLSSPFLHCYTGWASPCVSVVTHPCTSVNCPSAHRQISSPLAYLFTFSMTSFSFLFFCCATRQVGS